jgi:pimeloyl-ACP methyl ester carboxylesterase
MQTGYFLDRIPYIRAGRGPKSAVVFFGANALFQPLDRGRPQDYARMVEDILPPGYAFTILGYDPHPSPGYGFDEMVSEFAQFVRGNGGRTVIVGVSFGGFVAQRFAAAHAELVDRMVLMISAHRFSQAGWRKVLRQEAYMRSGDLYAFVKDMALLFRRPWYNWLLNLALWRARHRLRERFNDPDTMLRLYENLFRDFDNRPYLGRISAETLVVGGTRDQFFDSAAFEETAKLISRGRVHLFPGETHMVPIERSRDVRAVVAEFLGA